MLGLIALAGFLMGGLVLAAILGVAMFALKIVFWAVFLPFRIITKVLFKVVMIPIWLTLGVLGMAAGAVALPVVLLIAAGVAVFALLLPLLPFIMFGLIVWAFMRRRPAVVA